METLPHEVFAEILSYSGYSEILCLMTTSKKIYQSFHEDSIIWRILCNNNDFDLENNHAFISYRELYFRYYHPSGQNELTWLYNYDTTKSEWQLNEKCLELLDSLKNSEISIVTVIDLHLESSKDVLNTLTGYKNAFSDSVKTLGASTLPNIQIWNKPYRYDAKSRVLFLRATGLNNVTEENLYFRKCVMDMIILISSVFIVCVPPAASDYVSTLDSVLLEMREPSCLFATHSESPACLIVHHASPSCDREEISYPHSTDPLVDVPPQSNFASCLVNWFGKLHGIVTTSNQNERYRHDLWTFVHDVIHPLRLSWPLSRWDGVRPTGVLVKQYIEFININENKSHSAAFVNERSHVVRYDKPISEFAKKILSDNVVSFTEFYTRATNCELNPSEPLEMRQLVQVSEMHARYALQAFMNQSKTALFFHRTIEDFETLLKARINDNFRPLWRTNSRYSENYCNTIFDCCFKWIRAQCDCPRDEIDVNEFVEHFRESLSLFLENSRGTRTYFVMSFCASQSLQMVSGTHPHLAGICEQLMTEVERASIEYATKVEQERNILQRLTGYRLKLLTFENTIDRLNEDIEARSKQLELCELHDDILCERVSHLTCGQVDRERYGARRRLFIENAKTHLEHVKAQYQDHRKQFLNNFSEIQLEGGISQVYSVSKNK
ncbi:hypothetical protein AKO1_012013 [Acrasis kona]|uniref:F-box domain-containing protein n=1 Tax=Acrasis kona TaxID=1008807 RepID=A0AAW2ZAM0_9EUKA